MTQQTQTSGGCWCSLSDYCRSADRSRITPAYRDRYLGFRVLRSSEEEVMPRVLRGGSCHGYSALCCSAYRDGLTPGLRDYHLGFRVIKENKHDD